MNEQTSNEKFKKWFYDSKLNYNEEYRGAKSAWEYWSKRVEEMEKLVEAAKDLKSYQFGTTFNNEAGYSSHERFIKAVESYNAMKSNL